MFKGSGVQGLGFGFWVQRFSAAAGLKSGQFNLKRNFALGYFHMTG
jgi:hypothetical protein